LVHLLTNHAILAADLFVVQTWLAEVPAPFDCDVGQRSKEMLISCSRAPSASIS